VEESYRAEGASQTVVDVAELERLGVTTRLRPMLDCTGGLARHNPKLLAEEIMNLYREKSPTRIFSAQMLAD